MDVPPADSAGITAALPGAAGLGWGILARGNWVDARLNHN